MADILQMIFKHILLNENFWISIQISLKCVNEGLVYNKLALGSSKGLVSTKWQAITLIQWWPRCFLML